MNKKAIELSINFVVILILSIAILSASFILVNKFFGKASEMKARLDSETETKIRSLLVSGEKVAIPLHTKEVTAGKPVTFGIGISNVLREGGDTDEFIVYADPCENIRNEQDLIPITIIPSVLIKKNENEIVLALVNTEYANVGETYKCDIHVDYIDSVDDIDPAKGQTQYQESVYKAYVKIR